MNSLSFIYYVNQYTTALNLVMDEGWKFNSNYEAVQNYTGPNISNLEDYIKTAKDQFVDFPPLPSVPSPLSKGLEIKVPEEVFQKRYPDQSFVHSSHGATIRIRDPKNDQGNNACWINAFILKNNK